MKILFLVFCLIPIASFSQSLPQIGEFTSQISFTQKASCTSVLIGPKVLMTQGSCCKAGFTSTAEASFTGSKVISVVPNYQYSEFYPLTASQNMCLVILDKDVEGIDPLSISTAQPNINSELLEANSTQIDSIRLFSLDLYRGMYLGNTSRIDSRALLVRSTQDHAISLQGVSGDLGDSSALDACGDASMNYVAMISDSKHYENHEDACFKQLSESEDTFKNLEYRYRNSKHRPHLIRYIIPTNEKITFFPSFEDNINFLRKKANDNNLKICGLNTVCKPVIYETP